MELIPNGNVVPNWPAVGHIDPNASGNRARNSFGHDFQNAGEKWTKNLCKQDSDNDGKNNGEELGDPDCTWKAGDVPSRTVNITNPGVFNAFYAKEETVPRGSATGSPSTTGPPNSSSIDHDHMAEMEGWIVAHAIFMALSFGLIMPVSTLVPFFCRSKRPEGKWRDDHIKMMYFGNALGVLGFLIAVFSMGVENTLHGIVGVIVMIVGVLQSSLGYFRMRIPTRFKWKMVHSYVGRGMLLLVAFQLFFGYLELNKRVAVVPVIFGLIHFGLLSICFVLITRALRRRQHEVGMVMEDEPHTDFAPLESIGNVRSLQLS
jgi:hypothetical protein